MPQEFDFSSASAVVESKCDKETEEDGVRHLKNGKKRKYLEKKVDEKEDEPVKRSSKRRISSSKDLVKVNKDMLKRTGPAVKMGRSKRERLIADPFNRKPLNQLKETCESFIQDKPCVHDAPKLPVCRECRWARSTIKQNNKKFDIAVCRFFGFRKLRWTRKGSLREAGFCDYLTGPCELDKQAWEVDTDHPPESLSFDLAKTFIKELGWQFCKLFASENAAKDYYLNRNNDSMRADLRDGLIAWKPIIEGVREMCDICETSIFNFHWTCPRCGFLVCPDCFQNRIKGKISIYGAGHIQDSEILKDEYNWIYCSKAFMHNPDKFMLTQLIAAEALDRTNYLLHKCQKLLYIPFSCDCDVSRKVLKELATVENKIGDEETTQCNYQADLNEDTKEATPKIDPSNTSSNETTKTRGVKHYLEEDDDDLDPDGDSSSDISETFSPSCDQKKRKVLKTDTCEANWNISADHASFERGKQIEEESESIARKIYSTETLLKYSSVPHTFDCRGTLLRLLNPKHPDNCLIFQDIWRRGQPVMVSDVARNLNSNLWSPQSFSDDFGHERADLINCITGRKVPNQQIKRFWDGFDCVGKRLKDEHGQPMLLKLKDWPTTQDFADMLPSRFDDLMEALPLPEYTRRDGVFNIAGRLPSAFTKPDLGPKMYIAYGSGLHLDKGTTNLHLDISDAANVMVHVAKVKDEDDTLNRAAIIEAIRDSDCDALTLSRVECDDELPGALWHIYNPKDADKIRDLLNRVYAERNLRIEPHHDPIHDQSIYLDKKLRSRLMEEYNVRGFPILQCAGDAVFIPAGAPHQVRNLYNCIKIAEDFVSPENVKHCFKLTEEFRNLSDNHSNHEDKLQIKNIIYHAVKDALSVTLHNLQMD